MEDSLWNDPNEKACGLREGKRNGSFAETVLRELRVSLFFGLQEEWVRVNFVSNKVREEKKEVKRRREETTSQIEIPKAVSFYPCFSK